MVRKNYFEVCIKYNEYGKERIVFLFKGNKLVVNVCFLNFRNIYILGNRLIK